MWKSFVPPALFAAAIAAIWTYPPSRNFFLGRLDNNVGVLYAKGIGVRLDEAEAVRWYRAAAMHGDAAAAFNLAFALQQGMGTPVDEREAAVWYERAAARGRAEAANNLGLMYANPSHGQPNLVLARIWLKRALPLADHDLAATINENLQAMERDMQPAELEASEHPDAPLPVAPLASNRDQPASSPPDGHATPARKIRAALDAAGPLRAAVAGYVARHGRLPPAAVISTDAAFRSVESPQARISVGPGASVDIQLRGGAVDGRSFSLIPMYRSGNLQWICTKGQVPPQYFGSSCR